MAIWLVVVKTPRVDIAIAEGVLSKAFLHSTLPNTLVRLTILCQENAYPMLLTITDLALVIASTILLHLHVVWALHSFLLCLLKSLCEVLLEQLCLSIQLIILIGYYFNVKMSLCSRCSFDCLFLNFAIQMIRAIHCRNVLHYKVC